MVMIYGDDFLDIFPNKGNLKFFFTIAKGIDVNGCVILVSAVKIAYSRVTFDYNKIDI